MESKITAGTWAVNSSCVKANLFTPDEVVICEVNLINPIQGKKAPIEQQHANLFLMAKSPELRSVLTEILMSVFDWDEGCLYINGRAAPEHEKLYNKAIQIIQESKFKK